MLETCWLCSREHGVNEGESGNCRHCGVDINATFYKPVTEEEIAMGKLADRAREKSPFIRIEIGEQSDVLIYKGWKEITNSFGTDSFRYAFEQETESGLLTKQFDCQQQKFAEQMDTIAYGTKVVIHRKQKLDAQGAPVEKKSVYEVTMAE